MFEYVYVSINLTIRGWDGTVVIIILKRGGSETRLVLILRRLEITAVKYPVRYVTFLDRSCFEKLIYGVPVFYA